MRQRCPGCPNRFMPVVEGFGASGGAAIVGQAPGRYEAGKKQLFVGESGKLLKETLRQLGVKDVYFTNAVACAWAEEPTTEAVNACRQSLVEELREQGVTKVLAMGNHAIQALCPGSPAVTVVRPNRMRAHQLDARVVPTFNMAYVLRDPDVFRDVVTDIDILANLDTWVEPVAPTYTVVDSLRALMLMRKEFDRDAHMSMDIESTSYNPVEDELISLGLGDGHHVWIIVNELLDDPFALRVVHDYLTNKQFKVGQNWYQFDWKWFYKKYGIDSRCDFDPMLAHYLLDERQQGHNLKSMCKQYLGYPHYAEDIAGKYENYGDIPRDKLFQYQAWDVAGTWALYPKLAQELDDDYPHLRGLHDDILLPGAKALAIMELNGVTIDTAYLDEVARAIDKKTARLQRQLQVVAEEVGATQRDHWEQHTEKCRIAFEEACKAHALKQITGKEKIAIRKLWTQAKNELKKQTFNPGSTKQVKYLMWDKLRLTPHTRKADLEAVEHLHPAPNMIAFYRQLRKLKGTYITGLKSRIWASDQRLHGDFYIPGSRTGRISSRDPNLQNIPLMVGPVVRNAFVATEGWVLGEIDNSQVEMRIAGVLSRDVKMIKMFQNKQDIHKTVAAQMYAKPIEEITSQERYDAKPVNFAILYGSVAQSLVGRGDPPWDLEKATIAVNGFYNAFPDLARHFEIWKEEVKRDQVLYTIFGRVRRFPLITDANRSDLERIAINSRMQGSAADHLFTALAAIQLKLHARETVTLERNGETFTLDPNECRLLVTVHDSIVIETLPHAFAKYARWIQQEMQVTRFETHGMPFVSDIKCGKRWGSLHDWEEGDEFKQWDDDMHIEFHYVDSRRVPRDLLPDDDNEDTDTELQDDVLPSELFVLVEAS